MSEYLINPSYQPDPDYRAAGFAYLSAIGLGDGPTAGEPDSGERSAGEVLAFHRSLPGYAPTPLRAMPATARALGIGEIFVKDESERFGLNAFKPLGASFAVYRHLKSLCRERLGTELTPRDFAGSEPLRSLGPLTLCAATDGNHGRAVAWVARRIGQHAVIFMPASTVRSRVEMIRAEGAEVVLVDGSFDDCVERCAADARSRGWHVIADTAYPGYLEVPQDIILGYTTIFAEADTQLAGQRPSGGGAPAADGPTADRVAQAAPFPTELPRGGSGVDLVLLQTGVGGLAAAGIAYYALRYGSARPASLCVEPVSADGFLQSAKEGRPVPTRGALDSVMAGLNCGIPSLAAWPIVELGAHAFVAIEDEWAFRAMRAYAHEEIVSGESGAGGLAGLLALASDPELRRLRNRLEIGKSSRVLLINTEGATDPENYRRVVELDPSAVRGGPAR